MCGLMTNTLNRLKALPLVSVAALENGAIGGGAELATSCDFRILTNKSYVHFVQAQMGVSTGWGGAARLSKIIGPKNALYVLGWGQKIDSKKALEIGLADLVKKLFELIIFVSDARLDC
mmetsp:Transcript_2724/g.4073  ORF Transcript_2724/g.4073 Transcript_2724/m.4073 type:complete len:119 (+) Transcript_2724:58-414(+)